MASGSLWTSFYVYCYNVLGSSITSSSPDTVIFVMYFHSISILAKIDLILWSLHWQIYDHVIDLGMASICHSGTVQREKKWYPSSNLHRYAFGRGHDQYFVLKEKLEFWQQGYQISVLKDFCYSFILFHVYFLIWVLVLLQKQDLSLLSL